MVAQKSTRVKESRVFHGINTVIMTVFALLILIPVWTIVVDSFTNPASLMTGRAFRLLPSEFSLENYKVVFADQSIWMAFLISVLKTGIGVITHILFTAMVAFGMSKSELMGRKLYTAIGIITMFFGGGMIPTYLLIKSLNLLNSFWVFIIPALFSYYDMIIMMNFFREIPPSLEESAKIDGAGVWKVFLNIVLPLSKPVLCTIGLFNGVYQWNDYMSTKLYINDKVLYPIQMKLYEIIVQQQAQMMKPTGSVTIPTTSQSIQLATIVIATLPIIMVYPFVQKYFLSGMMVGAVKE